MTTTSIAPTGEVKIRRWHGVALSFMAGHLSKRIDWSSTRFEDKGSSLELVAQPFAKPFIVKAADVDAVKSTGVASASFWSLAFGRSKLPETISGMSAAGVDEFSKSLMEWIRASGDGVFTKSLHTQIGQMGGIDLKTAPGSIIWKRDFNIPKMIGKNVIVGASKEADEYVCHVIDAESNKLIFSQPIDPKIGLLFSWEGDLDSPLKRMYSARVDANNRTYFGSIKLLWPLKTSEGHVARWSTGESGEGISRVFNKKRKSLKKIVVRKSGGKEPTAYIIGAAMGSPASRFEGIRGTVELPLVRPNKNAKYRVVKYIRMPVKFSDNVLSKAGLSEAKSLVVDINGPYITDFHAEGLSVKLLYRPNSSGTWEFVDAETKRITPKQFEGVLMIQGMKLGAASHGKDSWFLGFRAGGILIRKLCSLPSRESKYPRHATAIFEDGELVFISLDYRIQADHVAFQRLGKILAKQKNNRSEDEIEYIRKCKEDVEAFKGRLEGALVHENWEDLMLINRTAIQSLEEAGTILDNWRRFKALELEVARTEPQKLKAMLTDHINQLQKAKKQIRACWPYISSRKEAKSTYIGVMLSIRYITEQQKEISVQTKKAGTTGKRTESIMDWVEGALSTAKYLCTHWDELEADGEKEIAALSLIREHRIQRKSLQNANGYEMQTNIRKISELERLVDFLTSLLEEPSTPAEDDEIFVSMDDLARDEEAKEDGKSVEAY